MTGFNDVIRADVAALRRRIALRRATTGSLQPDGVGADALPLGDFGGGRGGPGSRPLGSRGRSDHEEFNERVRTAVAIFQGHLSVDDVIGR
jgi:hypothetical protein